MHKVIVNHMNLYQIANSGQCFRWEQIKDNSYRIPAFGKELIITQDGNSFTMSCNEDEWEKEWKDYFDVETGTNYDEAEKIVALSNDDFLKTAYQYGNGIRILRQDFWEVLISFIISQNNNIPRIRKSIEAICRETGGKFPNFYELKDMDLSDKGLGYRDKYIQAACILYDDNDTFIHLMTDTQAKEYLMKFKGIGNKVADCICLFGLHHLEAFPIDTHVREVIEREYNGQIPEWAKTEYAGLLQQYIFYYELNKNKKKGRG